MLVQHLLLSTLIMNVVYLGYDCRFTNSRMFVDLLGSRVGVDLHSLNNTLFNIQKFLKLLTTIWLHFTNAWIVTPNNKIIGMYVRERQRIFTEQFLHFWFTKWRYGILTNMLNFSLLSTKLMYPALLIYINYSINRKRLIEGQRAGLLQATLADTNSQRIHCNYLINANEKSIMSYLLLINLIFVRALRVAWVRQKELFF